MYVDSRYFVRVLHSRSILTDATRRACGKLVKHGLVLPGSQEHRRTLIRSNAGPRSDSKTDSTAPLFRRPRPWCATNIGCVELRRGFHYDSWAASSFLSVKKYAYAGHGESRVDAVRLPGVWPGARSGDSLIFGRNIVKVKDAMEQIAK